VRAEGPDHSKRFFAKVSIAGVVRGEGDGRSKKHAEQAAARAAWQRLVPDVSDDERAPMPARVGADGEDSNA